MSPNKEVYSVLFTDLQHIYPNLLGQKWNLTKDTLFTVAQHY